LAGVEAGAKIFVPGEDEPLGPLAHTAVADQNRRNIVCSKNRNVEHFILNIDISLLPLSTSETRSITRFRTLSLFLLPSAYDSYRPEFD
jgi:hypothetical protein